MVRLRTTQAMVTAIRYCESESVAGWPPAVPDGEPPLVAAEVGMPISHAQVIDLSRCLREHLSSRVGDSDAPPHELAELLRGSQVHVEPPKPKPEQTSEYKTLMARLRHEGEARAYHRMVSPPTAEYPLAGYVVEEEDEVTYSDINRQVAAIFNVLLSVVACSAALWMAAGHWSTPSRLGISMGGAGLVGVAEVVIYAGYLRRVSEAKQKEKAKVETKEIVGTWTTSELQDSQPILPEDGPRADHAGLRLRTRAEG